MEVFACWRILIRLSYIEIRRVRIFSTVKNVTSSLFSFHDKRLNFLGTATPTLTLQFPPRHIFHSVRNIIPTNPDARDYPAFQGRNGASHLHQWRSVGYKTVSQDPFALRRTKYRRRPIWQKFPLRNFRREAPGRMTDPQIDSQVQGGRWIDSTKSG